MMSRGIRIVGKPKEVTSVLERLVKKKGEDAKASEVTQAEVDAELMEVRRGN